MLKDKFLRKSLGIELRDDSLIIVCLKKGITGIKIISSTVLPFNSNKAIEDTISELKRFITQHRIKTKSISVSIPKGWGLIRFIDIPAPGRDVLDSLIHYEIEKHIPFQVEDIYYDFQVVGKNGNSYKVMLVIVQREKIEYLKEFFRKIPLQPEIVNISSFCILNAIELSEYNTKVLKELLGFTKQATVFGHRNNVCISLFMGKSEWEIGVIKNGSCIYLKDIPFEKDTTSDILWNELFSEIDNTLTWLSIKKLDSLVFSGYGSSEMFKYGTGRADLKIANLKIIEEFLNLSVNTSGVDIYRLIPSIGVCLRGLGLGSIRINVLPEKKKENKRIGPLISKLFLCVILVLSIGMIISEIIRDKVSLKILEEEIRKNGPEMSATEQLTSKLNTIEKRKKFLLDVKVNNVSKLEILAELTDIIPVDVWLTSLVYKEIKNEDPTNVGELIIDGFAESSSRLISLLEDSPFFENVNFVGPIQKTTQGEGFKIKAVVVNPRVTKKNEGAI